MELLKMVESEFFCTIIKLDFWAYRWPHIKVSGPRVQTFCIEKDSHMDAI